MDSLNRVFNTKYLESSQEIFLGFTKKKKSL